MTKTEANWIAICVPLLFGCVTGCLGPVVEKPPCDEATLAQIVATCADEADCDAKIDARQSFCAKRIQSE